MSDVKLGQLIEGDPARDAIHMAVAPVVAEQDLSPGDHVGILPNGTAGKTINAIGIVDPFLTGKVATGEKFWLCLYQFTVTGMRHEWGHPAFGAVTTPTPTPTPTTPEGDAKAWIHHYANTIGMYTGESLIAAANDYLENQEYINVGTLEGLSVSEEFWKHFKTLTGKEGTGSFFSCSC